MCSSTENMMEKTPARVFQYPEPLFLKAQKQDKGPSASGPQSDLQLMWSQCGWAQQHACLLMLTCTEEQVQQFGSLGPCSTSGGCNHGMRPQRAYRVILGLENIQRKAGMNWGCFGD